MDRDLEAAAEIKVEPLKYREVPKSVHSGVEANKQDPMFRYVQHNVPDRDKSFMAKRRYNVIYNLAIADAARQKCAWTVNHGEALILLEHAPKDAAKRTRLDKLISTMTGLILKYLRLLDSPEQRKRSNEMSEKSEAVIKEAFGDAVADMRVLEGFVTAPEKQGQGYGTALAKHVCAIAESEGRATWLLSSNIMNTPFYEGLGFETVGEFTLGESNPTWKEDPVIIRIMVKRPAAAACPNVKCETV